MFGNEAATVKGLEESHAEDSLLRDKIAEVARVEQAKGLWHDDVVRLLDCRTGRRLPSSPYPI